MEDLESMLAKLHDQVVYCFVNGDAVAWIETLRTDKRIRGRLAYPIRQ
jgi:hypothetical protein